MPRSEMMITTIVEETYLSLEQVATLCSVEPSWILQHIEEGLLPAARQDGGDWAFSSVELTRARRLVTIERNFEAQPELAALVADLQEELDSLRRQLQYLTK